MFVGRRMTKRVIAVTPDTTLREAARLLKENRIHHLPVVEGERLVGIISDTDIRNATFEKKGEGGENGFERRVGEVMTKDVVTVNPWDTLEDALLILTRRRFGALPVVDEEKLVGIITKADILGAMIDTLDIEGEGVRIEVILPKSFDALHSLVHALSELEVEIRSLILAPHKGEYAAFVRVSTIDTTHVREHLREKGFVVPALHDFLD